MVVIAVGILALAAIAWRVRERIFTRTEAAILALVAGNWILIWAQINVDCSAAFPEKRYWIQSVALMCGWAVWGVDRIAVRFSGRFPLVRFLLPAAIGLLVIFDLVMIVKPHIPLGRRYAYNEACRWAEDIIRNDWQGPRQDAKNPFSTKEHHLPYRPVVRSFSQRLPYVLGGRRDNVHIFGETDMPDYIAVDTRKERGLPGKGYEKIAERVFGSRTFMLYRRNKPEENISGL